MEGLIPLVYKAIKRNKVRSQYRCLSVGAAQTYNIADFYDDGRGRGHDHDHDQGSDNKFYTPPVETRRGDGFDGRSHGHRRYASTGGFDMDGGGYNNNFNNYDHSPPKQIMKRYKSHRMFSCVTGGV